MLVLWHVLIKVGSEPETLDGINGTRWFITPDTMDGRFGANDTVQYVVLIFD